MKKFLLGVSLFSFIPLLIIIIGIILPATPRASRSLLFAKVKKDSLLANVQTPRIIFVGGSNLSFGLNSKIIKDSLGLSPINTGIHASLGLKYMIDYATKYIKEGDIIILIAEYDNFFGKYLYGSEELLHVILDIDHSELRMLDWNQFLNIACYIPKYSFSKFDPTEYINSKESEVYSVNAFNNYGDAFIHWHLQKQKVRPFAEVKGVFNETAINELLKFQTDVLNKKASLFISYPCYQKASFINSISEITEVALKYKRAGFKILGNPLEYMMPDSLMFDTPYHLTKAGADYRTNLFIRDFKDQHLFAK